MFSRFAIMPFSWRYTLFILLVIAAMVAVAVVRGDPTAFIVPHAAGGCGALESPFDSDNGGAKDGSF
jgi:hypothetical protein